VAAGTAAAPETLLLVHVATPGEPAKPLRQGPPAAPAPAAGPGVAARLAATRCSTDFRDAPLSAALDFFRDLAGVNLVVDRRVFDELPDAALRVNLALTDVTAADALALLLETTGLSLQERDGYGWITPGGVRGGLGGEPALAIYDVRDLTQPGRVQPFHGADLGGRIEPGRAFLALQETMGERWSTDQLADLIRGSVAPESWDTPPHVLEPKGERLILRNGTAALAEVDRLLGDLRAARHRPVLVEALHLECDAASWEAAKLGPVLSAAEADAVAARAAAGQGMRLAGVARVAGLHGHGFSVHAGRQLVVEAAPGERVVAADGLLVQICPVLSADGSVAHCTLLHRVQRADAAGALGAGLAAAEARTDVKVPAGGAVVLGGFAADGRPGSLVLLRVTPGR
jgi:hypothetical protein